MKKRLSKIFIACTLLISASIPFALAGSSGYHRLNAVQNEQQSKIHESVFENFQAEGMHGKTPMNYMKGDVLSHFRDTEGWLLARSVEAIKGKNEFKAYPKGNRRARVLYNGINKSKAVYLTTKEVFKDVAVDLEFMVPKGSNAGIYLMGRYEIQILDSYGVAEPQFSDLGGVYQRWDRSKKKNESPGFEGIPPRVNASKAPGKWQRLKIVFRAPRFDADGVKRENARFISVRVNGTLVQENVEVTGPTRSHPLMGEEAFGPISIQGNHGPIAIRKYQVTPLAKDPFKRPKGEWTRLFNRVTLSGWQAYTGKMGDESSLTGADIFKVSNGAIHTYMGAPAGSKQFNANLVSDSSYSNFHLLVEYRWLKNKFQPRTDADRDAGILFHIHSEEEKVWPPSIEMQLGESKVGGKYVTGDIFVIGNTRAQVPTEDGKFKAGGKLELRGQLEKKRNGRGATSVYAEKPIGEWNRAELIVHGSEKAAYYLNGKLVNEVHNMKFLDADGTWKPLESGKISVQGEWAELEYRMIRIKEIK